MYNCRFLFISIQKRTSLYYQSCHSLKNRERVLMLQNRRRSFFFYLYLWRVQIQKIELPVKKYKKTDEAVFTICTLLFCFCLNFFYLFSFTCTYTGQQTTEHKFFYKREYFSIFSVYLYQSLHFDEGTKTDEHTYPSTSFFKLIALFSYLAFVFIILCLWAFLAHSQKKYK